MNFLVITNNKSTGMQIKNIIKENGDKCICFDDIQIAIRRIKTKQFCPDIVILDLGMHEIKGPETIEKLREHAKKKPHLKIIFLTASIKDITLGKFLAYGDDVIFKPISNRLTKAKIKNLKKTLLTYQRLHTKKTELEKHHRLLEEERFLTEEIFDHFMSMNDLSSGNVQFHSSPSSTFNGDIFLAVRSPMDTLYIFLGDITGHGLPAAIGTIPIHKMFLAMARKGLTLREISHEINRTLYTQFPDHIFCAAIMMEMSSTGDEIYLWSGAMPPILLTDDKYQLIEAIPSDHMPLGSQSPTEFESNIRTLKLKPSTRCYLFTDGISELRDDDDELFGERRIAAALQTEGSDNFEKILSAAKEFGGNNYDDDSTLVELIAQPLQWKKTADEIIQNNTNESVKNALPWSFNMHLSGKDLTRSDPVSQIMHLFSHAAGIDIHQDTLSTIFTELYSNALEHGLLELDSTLKNNEDGFVDYYLQRSERLRALKYSSHAIDISINFKREANQSKVEITITNSGSPFNPKTRAKHNDMVCYGNGMILVESLCSELIYSNDGRTAKASYLLQ